MKTLEENGVVWLYRPGIAYVAKVDGIDVTVRRMTGAIDRTIKWRLFVDGNIAMGEQFHHDLRAARRIGIARARRILEEFRAR